MLFQLGDALASGIGQSIYDSFNGDASGRYTKNAPANDASQLGKGLSFADNFNTSTNTAFQYPSIPMPEMNRQKDFEQQYKENQLTAQQALQTARSAAAEQGEIALRNYRAKTAIDSQAQQQRARNATGLGNPRSASGGVAVPNYGGWSAPQQQHGSTGFSFFTESQNDRKFRDAAEQRDFAAQTARRIRTAEAAGDIARMDAQARNERQNARFLNNINVGNMNRQASIDAQRAANDYTRQAREAALQRASQERVAGMQAAGSLYGSMFGALSAPGANYRYWN